MSSLLKNKHSTLGEILCDTTAVGISGSCSYINHINPIENGAKQSFAFRNLCKRQLSGVVR